MKRPALTLLPALLLGLASLATAQSVSLKPVWETDTTLRTPESVLLDPARNVLYVACINGGPTLANNGSYIAKLGLDGKVINLKFTDKLNSTKGMGILGNSLYVTEMTQVAQIDLATGAVQKRYPIEGAKFLNDIAVDPKKGVIYITDSNDSKVWALANGKTSLVLGEAPLKGTNGLLFENNRLLIGNGDGSLLSFDLGTKQLKTLGKVSGGIDGIVALGNNTYMVTEWGGKVWYIGADGTSDLKLDTSTQKISSADIGYNPATGVVYVPTFFHNTVKAYSIR
ncbi:ATP/GTP-binding protein [Spirosoma luteolum]